MPGLYHKHLHHRRQRMAPPPSAPSSCHSNEPRSDVTAWQVARLLLMSLQQTANELRKLHPTQHKMDHIRDALPKQCVRSTSAKSKG